MLVMIMFCDNRDTGCPHAYEGTAPFPLAIEIYTTVRDGTGFNNTVIIIISTCILSP